MGIVVSNMLCLVAFVIFMGYIVIKFYYNDE